ncbi:12630_t:CDS:2 [Cetraspora pellucida]|uniref:12630_t:CDS:1 n=1 Tax=Cetraspora pellucida TaxID=1433469 RepID=A0A9N9DC54_9GLOM|nr:12630_t:CDS:2 [Cetraspora pellucida]
MTQFTFTPNEGMQFAKSHQKNDQGGVDGCSDALVIPIPPDPENYYLLKDEWYLDSQLGEKSCQSLMKNICATVNINLEGRDIVNHSGRSTPITSLFQKGVPTVTTMSLTGHKSELSYRIYAWPSQQQKEEALSLLINNVGTLPLKNSNVSSSLNSSNSLKVANNSEATTNNSRVPNMQNSEEQDSINNGGNKMVKNYYINTESVTIN